MPKFYTISEAAKILRFSPFTLYRWIHEGKIKAVKIGSRSYRIGDYQIKNILNFE